MGGLGHSARRAVAIAQILNKPDIDPLIESKIAVLKGRDHEFH